MRRSVDLTSILSQDDLAEYDIISDGQQSLESSIADLGLADKTPIPIHEPAPTKTAEQRFGTPALSAEDIRAYVGASLGTETAAGCQGEHGRRAVRVYVDGLFDPFDAGHALQLRQAKLSFPAVQLLVGVFSDEVCTQNGVCAKTPDLERCEMLRHCRWVDEVVPDAPWKLDEAFLNAMRIDYVAIDEGASIDPAYPKERVKGYDLVKSLRKAIPTRRTSGLSRIRGPTPLPPPVSPPPVPSSPPLPSLPPPKPQEMELPLQASTGNGTIRRVPPPRVERKDLEPGESPFEEPLVDLFD